MGGERRRKKKEHVNGMGGCSRAVVVCVLREMLVSERNCV